MFLKKGNIHVTHRTNIKTPISFRQKDGIPVHPMSMIASPYEVTNSVELILLHTPSGTHIFWIV